MSRLLRAGLLTVVTDGLFSSVLVVAAGYGPLVWTVMSLVVIPALVRRPPSINFRWWVQFIGHFPFVGLPIVAGIGLPAAGGEAAVRG